MGYCWRGGGDEERDDNGMAGGLAMAEVAIEEAHQKRDILEIAIASLLKLEGLLIKEGLTHTPLANTYRSLAKWSARLVALKSEAGGTKSQNDTKANEVRKWKQKELEVCEMCFGRESERYKALRIDLEDPKVKRGEDRDM